MALPSEIVNDHTVRRANFGCTHIPYGFNASTGDHDGRVEMSNRGAKIKLVFAHGCNHTTEWRRHERLLGRLTLTNRNHMPPTLLAKSTRWILWAMLAGLVAIPLHAFAQTPDRPHPSPQSLWDAARRGELESVKQAVEAGVDVNAVTHYGAAALSFAADRGHLEIVQFLLSKQADPNIKDTFYNATPMTWASAANRYEIMKALVLAGANDVDTTLVKAIAEDDLEIIRHITTSGKASRGALMSNLSAAKEKEKQAAVAWIEQSLATFYPEAEIPPPTSKTDNDRKNIELAHEGFPASSPQSLADDLAVSGPNWGQFRGTGARGIADGQRPATNWDADKGQNLAWKTPIPGLGHSCPVVWNDRLFITTAISSKSAAIRTGVYGDVTSVEDDSEHEFVTYCLSAETGETLWQQTACKRTPRVKRHLKSTHANSTVATDGTHVVAWFGSEGVYCYTMDGQLIWEKDLGLLDSGWFYDRDYQWQFGASPIIHNDRLILLCDIQDQSFIAMYDVATGNEIWKTNRDEIPSWSTPTVVETPTGLQIVTNATGAARGYEFETGEEIWQIKRNSEIAVPTPFAARGLIYISSGYRPIQPIYAIRLDATGDLTLDEAIDRSDSVAWSDTKGGPYMPTPIVYGDYLYICSNSGILTCHQAATGNLVYKKRLPMKTNRSFVGSPIAADGNLFLTSEEGETAVIQAGPAFKLISHNFCGENCLTTPAISSGSVYIRGQNHVFALRRDRPDDTSE